MGSCRLIREASLVQNGIHEVSRRIAREGTSGSVGTMSSRCKAHDQNSGVRIAESGNRFSPVVPLAIRTSFLARDLLAVSHQAWAASAGNYFAVQDVQPSRKLHFGWC